MRFEGCTPSIVLEGSAHPRRPNEGSPAVLEMIGTWLRFSQYRDASGEGRRCALECRVATRAGSSSLGGQRALDAAGLVVAGLVTVALPMVRVSANQRHLPCPTWRVWPQLAHEVCEDALTTVRVCSVEFFTLSGSLSSQYGFPLQSCARDSHTPHHKRRPKLCLGFSYNRRSTPPLPVFRYLCVLTN